MMMFFAMIFATVRGLRSETLSKPKPAPRFILTK
jgi:hypothetical protein